MDLPQDTDFYSDTKILVLRFKDEDDNEIIYEDDRLTKQQRIVVNDNEIPVVKTTTPSPVYSFTINGSQYSISVKFNSVVKKRTLEYSLIKENAIIQKYLTTAKSDKSNLYKIITFLFAIIIWGLYAIGFLSLPIVLMLFVVSIIIRVKFFPSIVWSCEKVKI